MMRVEEENGALDIGPGDIRMPSSDIQTTCTNIPWITNGFQE